MSFKQRAFEQQVQHLVHMVRLARTVQAAGMLDYARHRAAELQADQSGLYVGLVDAVRSALAGGPARPGGCEPPTQVKPH